MQKNMKILAILLVTIAILSVSYLCVNQAKASTYDTFFLSYSVSDTSIPTTAPTFTYVDFNTGPQVVSLTTSPVAYEVSSGSSWSISNPAYGNGLVRWETNNATLSGTASADTVLNPTYYRQFYVTYSYSTSDASTPSPAARFYGYQYGTKGSFSFTASTQSVWLDAQTVYSFDDPIYTPSLTEQWAISNPASASGQVTGPISVTPLYYHQFDVVFQYSVNGGASGSSAPTASYTKFGTPLTKTAATDTSVSDWVDATTAVTYTNPLVGSGGSERWQTDLTISSGVSTVASSVGSSTSPINPTYYHQYLTSFAYTTDDDSTIHNVGSGLAIGNFAQFNSYVDIWSAPGSGYGAAVSGGTASSDWVNAGSNTVAYYRTTVGDEAWAIAYNPTLGTYANEYSVTGSGTITETHFYHQYYMGLYAHPTDLSGIPTGALMGTYTQFGSSINFYSYYSDGTYTYTTGSDNYGGWTYQTWVDAAGSITFTTYTATSGTERWALSAGSDSFSGLSLGPGNNIFEYGYYHQYEVSFGYSVVNSGDIDSSLVVGHYWQFGSSNSITSDGSGGVSPSSATWVDAGAGNVNYVTAVASSTTERWALASSPDSMTFLLPALFQNLATITNLWSVSATAPTTTLHPLQAAWSLAITSNLARPCLSTQQPHMPLRLHQATGLMQVAILHIQPLQLLLERSAGKSIQVSHTILSLRAALLQ